MHGGHQVAQKFRIVILLFSDFRYELKLICLSFLSNNVTSGKICSSKLEKSMENAIFAKIKTFANIKIVMIFRIDNLL